MTIVTESIKLDPYNIPITLYVHLPFCLKKCPYCDFTSYAHATINRSDYLNLLIKQAQAFKNYLQDRSINAIFIGGGTPNLFSPEELDHLLNSLHRIYSIKREIEITIEANPALNNHYFSHYRKIGINRLSLGIQTFKGKHLKKLGRLYSREKLMETLAIIKKSHFKSLNFDLMYGLPEQTKKEALNDLKIALQQKPSHLSWYQLTVAPHTPFGEKELNLPNADTIWEMEEEGKAYLIAHGLQQYEISSYAILNFESQHNLNYWQFGDYIGIGAGAHSKITEFKKQQIIRIENCDTALSFSKKFIKREQIISSEKILLEFMINTLRLRRPFPIQLLAERTGIPLTKSKSLLERAIEKGFLKIKNGQIYLTSRGNNFTNHLLELF